MKEWPLCHCVLSVQVTPASVWPLLLNGAVGAPLGRLWGVAAFPAFRLMTYKHSYPFAYD